MGKKRAIIHGSAVISIGEIACQICGLIRNIFLARILTKEDFGIAAMLGMTVSLMEIGGRLSIENFIIQSKPAERSGFLSVGHFIQFLLGLASFFLLLVSAGAISKYFGVPEAKRAFELLSLLPLLRSLMNMDVFRMVADFRFAPSVLIEVVPQLIITVLVFPLAKVWPSYLLLLWLLIGKQVVSTVTSHVLSENPYRWALDRDGARRIFQFGWPMCLSGFLLFCTMQGDRFAVGLRFTPADLGVYSVAATLSLVPAAALMKISGSLMLPLMSQSRHSEDNFRRSLVQAAELLALFAAVYAIVMIVAGESVIKITFGDKYRDAGILIAWLGFSQAVRLLRCVPTVAAMALGDSKNIMFSNFLRLSGLIFAFAAAAFGGSLWQIAAGSAIGELVALVGSHWRLSRRHGISFTLQRPSLTLAAISIVFCSLLYFFNLGKLSIWLPIFISLLLFVANSLAFILFCAELRRIFRETVAPRFFTTAQNA